MLRIGMHYFSNHLSKQKMLTSSQMQSDYTTTENTAVFNLENLHLLGMPVATIKAVHSSSAAASAKPDDVRGLYPIIHLAKGARVMLTANLWQQIGLCNGAAGTVYEFIYYAEGHSPPSLPISVLVDFDNYIGPSFLHQLPKCIPIPPVTCEWHSTLDIFPDNKYHSFTY